ncbi:MAG: CPP1-like family protein [Clostridiales bacterium]|nr:CPP1-like family protein [Clostridiales bacterium]
METKRSVKQYRMIDLSLMSVLLLIFETIIIMAANRWFSGEPYTVSLTPVITAIILIRWGPWAGIHALLGGLILCLESRAAPVQYAVYCIGNLFSLLVLPIIRKMGGDRAIRADTLKTFTYGLLVLMCMQVGRALVGLILGTTFGVAFGFFTTEVITDLFTLVILWIVRRLDGILEEQQHYLKRIHMEEQDTRNGGML